MEPAAARKPSMSGVSSGSQMAGLYDLAETLGKGHFAVVKGISGLIISLFYVAPHLFLTFVIPDITHSKKF